MSLRPTAHRILVQPDTPPEETATGLVLPQDRDHVPVSGTVVALGPGGSAIRYKARQRGIKDCLEVVESALRNYPVLTPLLLVRDEIAGLLGSSEPEREVAVGDRVAFAAEVGLKVDVEGQDYILLNEDDVAVVATEEVAAA